MNEPVHKQVVILGGYGAFGALISDQLVKISKTIIVGRDPLRGKKYADAIGSDFLACDVREQNSLKNMLAPGSIIINASGPFPPNDYLIPETCIEAGCHYIDLADGREYVSSFPALDARAKAKGVFACSGASTTPAVTHALVSARRGEFSRVDSINVYLSAGNKNKPGASTFESILSYAGSSVRVWRNGKWTTSPGWGLAESFSFPSPVGNRLVQLCNVPDLELFPQMFGANTVVFKAGVELALFNIALSVLAALKQRVGSVHLPALARPLVALSRLFKRFGSYSGGVIVNIQGDRHAKSIGFVTSQNGPRIPTAPAVLLAKRIIQRGAPASGAYTCTGFITLDELHIYLRAFGIQFVEREEGVGDQGWKID